jgi:3-deoxy-D-manno-octulosonate 8-phosphate phosphatase (KDO 8-P phosphatase)
MLAEQIARIEMLVLDVDGVLTDGRVTYVNDGQEIKSFNVRDGAGIHYWIGAGKQAAIISGRKSPAVQRRAAELGIERVIQGASQKLPALKQLVADANLETDQVAVVGDDLPDLPLLRNCGLGIAVADACDELRAAAHWVTNRRGGRGAVRETIELLMRGQGLWQRLLDRLQSERL